MKCFVFLLAVLVAVECRGHLRNYLADEDEGTDNCVGKDVDGYIDKVLEKAREELPDPMRLPSRSTFVELDEGSLWGMSELKRVGSATVTCEDNKITIEAKITVDELKGRYTWTKERGPNKSDKTGYVVFISDDFEVDTTVVLEKDESEETHPRLEKFVIQKFKKVRVEITGMGFFTWALGEMTTLFSGIFQRVIASTVQDPIKEALEQQMREISLH